MNITVDLSLAVTVEAKAAASEARFRAAVNAERDRRLAAGATILVQGYGRIPLQGRPEDRITLLALKDTARDLLTAGTMAPAISFRDAEDTDHFLTPEQMLVLADGGKAATSALYRAAWALKATDPRPCDVTDDALWP